MTRLLPIFMPVLLFSSLSSAQGFASFKGEWSVTIGRQTFAVLTLDPTQKGVRGRLTMPEHFETNGFSLSHVSGRPNEAIVEKGILEGKNLHLIVHPLSDPSDQDEWVMSAPEAGVSTLRLPGMHMTPWPLRATRDAHLSRTWDADKTYFFMDNNTSSEPLRILF